MTTLEPLDTIAVTSSTTDGSPTMMKADTVTAMKALHAQGHSATKIGKLLGCGRNTVLRRLRQDFEPPRRAQPPGVLDAHEDFLLERFLRHDGNADVVHQELKTELGIEFRADGATGVEAPSATVAGSAVVDAALRDQAGRTDAD